MPAVTIETVISSVPKKRQKDFLRSQTSDKGKGGNLLAFCSRKNWQDASIRAADAYFVEIGEQSSINAVEKIGYGLIALAGQDPHYKERLVWERNPPDIIKALEAAVIAAGDIALSINNLPDYLRLRLTQSNGLKPDPPGAELVATRDASEGFQDGPKDHTASAERAVDLLEEECRPIDVPLPEEVHEADGLVEGAVRTITVNAYERNPEARLRCIEAHGTSCCICGFSFGVVYGPEAEGYIHVHHVRPLSEVGGEYAIDPVEDLRPVCPNCHAVLHLGGRCRSIEEVRQLLGRNRA
jgi:hypothetical protein